MRVIDWLFLISLIAVVDFGIVAVFLWPVDQPKPRYVIIRVPAPQVSPAPAAPIFKPPPIKRHKPKFCTRQKLTALYDELDSWMSSSAVDRIRSKALQAKGVVARVIANVEADLDSINAAEPELERDRAEAVAPHFAAIKDTKSELAGIKDALNILSNGGPSLNELEPTVQGLNSAVQHVMDPALDQAGKKQG